MRNIYIIAERASVCQNYATKTEALKIAFRAARVSVWIVMRRSRGNIELQGDSDAAIVKGLIAVVFILTIVTPQDDSISCASVV